MLRNSKRCFQGNGLQFDQTNLELINLGEKCYLFHVVIVKRTLISILKKLPVVSKCPGNVKTKMNVTTQLFSPPRSYKTPELSQGAE